MGEPAYQLPNDWQDLAPGQDEPYDIRRCRNAISSRKLSSSAGVASHGPVLST